MDPFILLISVRLLTINIRTRINCLQDLNPRLKVGFVGSCGRGIFLLLLHEGLVHLCFNASEHSVLAIQIFLITHLVLELLPLSEHEGNSQILGRGWVFCMMPEWQAGQSRPIINNHDIVNFTPKNSEFFIKLWETECLCLAWKTFVVLADYAVCGDILLWSAVSYCYVKDQPWISLLFRKLRQFLPYTRPPKFP